MARCAHQSIESCAGDYRNVCIQASLIQGRASLSHEPFRAAKTDDGLGPPLAWHAMRRRTTQNTSTPLARARSLGAGMVRLRRGRDRSDHRNRPNSPIKCWSMRGFNRARSRTTGRPHSTGRSCLAAATHAHAPPALIIVPTLPHGPQPPKTHRPNTPPDHKPCASPSPSSACSRSPPPAPPSCPPPPVVSPCSAACSCGGRTVVDPIYIRDTHPLDPTPLSTTTKQAARPR